MRIPRIGETARLCEVGAMIRDYLAERRQCRNRAKGVVDHGVNPEPDRPGVAGELLFCAMAGIWPGDVFDTSLRSTNGGTDRGDIPLDGIWLDVKASTCPTARLLVPQRKVIANCCPVFALVVLSPDLTGGRLRGYFPAALLLQEWRLKTELRKPPGREPFEVTNYVADRSELVEWEEAVAGIPVAPDSCEA